MPANTTSKELELVRVESRLYRWKQRVPKPAKASVRVAARSWARATASNRTNPDFLIIGTKRGGTTSTWNALLRHPDMLPMFPAAQELKSPHYFDINYSKGPAWYRSHFPTIRQREAHQERTGHAAISGEASPYYMFHPLAAERMAADLPGIKLIVSLRDPVERIMSHYAERVTAGTERLSFEDALAAERGRLQGEAARIIAEAPSYYSFHHDMSSYLARGHYLQQLRPYLERFGGQLLILRAEDYYHDEVAQLQTIADFLGVRPFPEAQPKPDHFNKVLRPPMNPATRQWLINYYRPHVEALERALGRSFGWPNFPD